MTHYRSVLITGGTDGIGLALAELHIALGDCVYVVGKRKLADTPLAPYRSHHLRYIQHDLTKTACIDTIWSSIHSNCHLLDCVYLNAAIGFSGDIHSHPLPHIQEMIEIGMTANIALLNGLSPLLSVRSIVRIIGSLAAYYHNHSIAVYSAVKAGLATLVDNINAEHSYQCTISYIVIGAVRTNFHKKSGMTAAQIEKINGASTKTVAHSIYTSPHKKLIVIGIATKIFLRCLKIISLWQILTSPIAKKTLSTKKKRWLSTHIAQYDNQTTNKQALIVGAAEGIGLVICGTLIQAGYTLVVIDYQEQKLRQAFGRLASVDIDGTPRWKFKYCDLTDRNSVAKLVDDLSVMQQFDVVYLPAAISAVAPFCTITTDIYHKLIQCNSAAHLQILCGLLQHNRINAQGSIVLFSSLAHLMPYPGAAVYSATKTMMAVIAQSLHHYLRNVCGVNIYAAILGPVNTQHAHRYSPDNSRTHLRYEPQFVAQSLTAIVTDAKKHAPLLFISHKDKLIALCSMLFPRLMQRIIKQAIFDKLTVPLLPF